MTFAPAIPAALQAFAAVAAVAGTAATIASESSRASAERKSAEFEQDQLDDRARTQRTIAARNEVAIRRDTRRQLARQRASFLQAGGGLGGSALDVAGQSAIEAELDALNVRFQGEAAATGAENQALGAEFRGRQARAGGRIGVATALIGGTNRVAGSLSAFGRSSAAPLTSPLPVARPRV